MTTTTPVSRSKRRGNPARRSAEFRPAEPERTVDALPRIEPGIVDPPVVRPEQLVAALVLLVAGGWSYLPTALNLVQSWLRVDDYAHGFFVVPLAICFLWIWRGSFPGLTETSPLPALALFALSVAMRHAGDYFFFTFLDAWSLLAWLAAVALAAGGWPLLGWSWPAIAFLAFMIPLPFSVEHELSGPLQRVATIASTAILQALGQPALAEGNVIQIDDVRLEVAQACSGLRLFMGIAALTYVYVALVRRPSWEKAVLIAAAAPIAIAANVLRIVVTGLLYRTSAGPDWHEWIHDGAGWAMVAFAAVAFWLLLVYLRLLIREDHIMDMTAVVKQSRACSLAKDAT